MRLSKLRSPTAHLALALTTLGFASSPARSATLQESIDSYLESAEFVTTALQSADPVEADIVARIDSMLTDALPVLSAFSAHHTQCQAQLDRVVELYPQIAMWSPTQIRNNIERATVLPPAQGCYPARDIVAHPAIVRAVARTPIAASRREALLAEMNEAIEHMTQLRTELIAP